MKKFFSAILLMTAMVLSVGTFVACNDLTEEMEAVQTQATQNSAAIKALETQISALQTALATAQSTADAAKKAGDDAAAAAATAKAEAIAAAKDEVAALKAIYEAKVKDLEAALAGKASKEDLQKAIDDATAGLNTLAATLGARIDGIEAGLNKLATVAQLNEEVAKLVAADADLALQIAALKAYSDTTYATVAEAEAIRALLADLAEKAGVMEGWIGTNTSMIATLVEDVDIINAALKTYMDETDATISDIAVRLATALETADAASDKANMIEEALAAYMPETDKKISDIAVQIATALEDIDNLGQLIETANANITIVANAVSAAAEDIDLLKADVATLKAGLEAVTPRVEDLESEVATISTDLSTLAVLVKNTLRSITFIPETYVDGIEAVAFNKSIVYLPMAEDAKNGKVNDAVVLPSDEEAIYDFEDVLSASAVQTIKYHFNPSSFDLTKADYKFLVKKATNIDTKAAAEFPFWATDYTIVPTAKDGVVTVPVRRANVWQTMTAFGAEKFNIIALEATIKADANQVTSPYVMAYDAPFEVNSLAIACNKAGHHTADFHLAETYVEAQAEEAHFEMVYNKPFNLKELIETHKLGNKEEDFDLAAYEMTYRFSKPTQPYEVQSMNTKTDQQTVVTLTSATEGTYALTEGFGLEAVGRTPILRVEILDKAGNIVKRAYVKVKMVVERKPNFEVTETHDDVVYNCPTDKNAYIYGVEWMRKNIYRAITSQDGKETISHELFWATYAQAEAYVTNGTAKVNVPAPYIVSGSSADDRATKEIKWEFTDGEASAALGNKLDQTGKKLWGVLVLENKYDSSEYPAKVTVKFEVNVKLPDVTATYKANEVYWAKDGDECVAFVSNVNTPEFAHSPAAYCQFNTYIADAFVAAPAVTGKPACGTLSYRISPEWKADMAAKYPTLEDGDKPAIEPDLTDGVMLDTDETGLYITLDKNNENVKLLLNSPEGLYTVVEYVYTFENGCEDILFSFPVIFVQPVHMNTPADLQVQDAKTGGDVVEYNVFNLLTDWRNEPIIPTGIEVTPVATPFWNKVCAPHFEYVPEQTIMVKEGHYEVEFDSVLAEVATEVYGATATVTLTKTTRGWWGHTTTEKVAEMTITEDAEFATPDMAASALNAQFEAIKNNVAKEQFTFNGKSYRKGWGESYSATMGTATETKDIVAAYKEIKFVTGIEYIPAEFETIPEQWIETPCNEKPATPDYVIEYGERVGCWEWTEAYFENEYSLTGQYWEFYGPIEIEVESDLTKITTSLESKKLPSSVTLVVEPAEVGTITYKNIGTPVEHPYNIYIPVTVKYGWGSFKDVMTVKVIPHTQK